MLERSSYTGDMNKLSTAKRCQVLSAIVEGCAVNATARMTGVSVPTILKLVLDAGDACAEAHHETVRAVKAKRVQADEMWSFVGKKERNATEADKACGMGDAWVWMALCADSKLIVSYLVGPRTAESAAEFMLDLASRLASRVQLSTDGLRVYVDAVEEAFGADIDYAQLVVNGHKDRREDIEETTRGAKLLAMELGIPILLLSQPNNTDAKDGTVGFYSGKGSGSISADCDLMLIPSRSKDDPSKAGLEIAGGRHAEPRKWEHGSLHFDGARMLFAERKVGW